MKVARRAHVPAFAVMEIIARANQRRAAGQSVLNLCAGEPSSGAAEAVRQRAMELLAGGDLGYTEALGSPALRQEIAGHYRRRYDLDVDPARIAVTTGSSGGFMLAFLGAFEVGDRVALARPGYPAYRNILTALGCDVVQLDCGPESRYQPTVDQLEEVEDLEGPLDGLMLASPANPTGTMVSAAELDRLATWCAEREVRLISDEIYHGITYGDPAPSAVPYVPQGAVVINSFSKYWAMTGWRLGWMILPDDLVEPIDALAGNVALCPPALAQHAGIAAFSDEGYAAAEANVAQYRQNRELALGRLGELGWHRTAPADGAFYLYADISAAGLDSVTWCERLLDEAGVALTPGTDFDTVHGQDWVRLSFATSTDVLDEAIDRVVAWQRSR